MKIKLPKQPKVKNFTEAQFQGKVTRWMVANAWASFPYELKISQGKTISFKAFRPQQLPKLWKARTGIQHHKISDAGLLSPAPYDAYVFRKSFAYVGLLFNAKTNHNVCYFVDIVDIINIMKTGAKAIKLDEAEALGRRVVV